jgi:hypothetical protein
MFLPAPTLPPDQLCHLGRQEERTPAEQAAADCTPTGMRHREVPERGRSPPSTERGRSPAKYSSEGDRPTSTCARIPPTVQNSESQKPLGLVTVSVCVVLYVISSCTDAQRERGRFRYGLLVMVQLRIRYC